MTAIVNGKHITAKTLTQIKRLASIEANKNYKMRDEFYLFAPGFPPVLYIRRNKKYPNNTIIRGEWR